MNLFKLLCDHQELRDRYNDLFNQVLNRSECSTKRILARADMIIVQEEFRSVCDQLTPYKN